jgi:hypothetical protein
VSFRVDLTPEQEAEALTVARRVAAKYRTVAGMRYAPDRPLDEIAGDGFGAELAVSIATGQTWHMGDAKRPDVGSRTEVRHTRIGRFLFAYRKDPTSRLFVLVTGIPPAFEIEGWLPGSEGKAARFWRPAGNGYLAKFWIPASALRPLSSFPDLGPDATIRRPLLAARICPSCSKSHPPLTLCSG